MTFQSTLKKLERVTIDHSPEILTAIGVIGSFTTAFLASKATIKAYQLVELEEAQRQEVLEPSEIIRLCWKVYIPAATSAALTTGAIVGSAQVNNRRAAAMAAAYSVSERAFGEYRAKVIERVGENKERAYRDEIAQDRVNARPASDSVVVVTENGDVLCFDHYTGRYFKSSMESLRQAENQINFDIISSGYASLSDFYHILGVPPTAVTDEVGWNTDNPLKLRFSAVMSEDNRPCIAIDFDVSPRRKYDRFS